MGDGGGGRAEEGIDCVSITRGMHFVGRCFFDV